MSGEKHTSGPWAIVADEDPDAGWVVVAGDLQNRVAFVEPAFEPTLSRNARLIAAAPDLLALARQYAAECGECDGTGVIEVERTRMESRCCGKPNRDGSCCGNAIPWPEPYIDASPCPDCIEIRQVINRAVGP